MPVTIVSTRAGVWLVRRVGVRKFYLIIYIVMIGVGGQLPWKVFT